jgi:hypothetical protein
MRWVAILLAALAVSVMAYAGGVSINGQPQMSTRLGVAETDDATWSKSIPASSTVHTLPVAHGRYLIIPVGNAVYILTGDGADPTVTTAAGGFAVCVPEGVPVELKLDGDRVAIIGTSATGTVSFTLITED